MQAPAKGHKFIVMLCLGASAVKAKPKQGSGTGGKNSTSRKRAVASNQQANSSAAKRQKENTINTIQASFHVQQQNELHQRLDVVEILDGSEEQDENFDMDVDDRIDNDSRRNQQKSAVVGKLTVLPYDADDFSQSLIRRDCF